MQIKAFQYMGLVFFSFLCLWGCASGTKGLKADVKMEFTKDSVYKPTEFWPDKKLEKRFEDYWGYRFARNAESAFQMEAPYVREGVSYVKYRTYAENMKVGFSRIDLRNRTYETEHVLVVDCTIFLSEGSETREIRFTDRWLFMDGEWYHILRDPIYFSEID